MFFNGPGKGSLFWNIILICAIIDHFILSLGLGIDSFDALYTDSDVICLLHQNGGKIWPGIE